MEGYVWHLEIQICTCLSKPEYQVAIGIFRCKLVWPLAHADFSEWHGRLDFLSCGLSHLLLWPLPCGGLGLLVVPPPPPPPPPPSPLLLKTLRVAPPPPFFRIELLGLNLMSSADCKRQDWTSLLQTSKICLSGQQRMPHDREINLDVCTINWMVSWLIDSVVDWMVNFDVSNRLELSRLEIIHADTQVALSIDLKIVPMVDAEIDSEVDWTVDSMVR